MPIMIPPSTPTGVLRFQWIDINNVTRELSRDFSPNLFVPIGSSGLNAPTFEVSDDKLPFSPGTFVRQISTTSRTIDLPLVARGDDISDTIQAAENLADWFYTGDETGGIPGKLRITRPDDSVRQINAYCIGGLDTPAGDSSPNLVRYVPKLYCPDPYPTDTDDIVLTKTGAEMDAGVGIMNSGKLDAYPRWKFKGPWQNMIITNETTGKSFTITHSAAGTVDLYIDTRPSELRDNASTYDETDTTRLEWIEPDSVYFPLVPGLNTISWVAEFYNPSITYVEITYLQRYRTLLR